MFGASLVPAAIVGRKPQAPTNPFRQISDGWLLAAEPEYPQSASGLLDLEAEIRMVLTAAGRAAQTRHIDLQMAVEPRLVAQADAAPFRSCLREVVAGAIDRAESGILVTAMRRGGRVDVEVLDDGNAPSGAPCASDGVALPHARALPAQATLVTEFRGDRGTKVVLGLPQPDRLPPSVARTRAETADPDHC